MDGTRCGPKPPPVVLARDRFHARAETHAVTGPFGELGGESCGPVPGPHEHRCPRRAALRVAKGGLRPPDQRPLRPLPPVQLGERCVRGQGIDIAAEEAREERRERPIGGLVPQSPAQESAQRLVAVVAPLADHEVAERATPAATRQPLPMEEVAQVSRDAERRARRIRNEPTPGPQPRAGRGRPRHLEPELAAEVRRPRLPAEEGIGAGIQRDAGHLHRPQRPAGTLRRLQHDDLDRWIGLEPEGSRETGDAGADDGDPSGRVSHRARIERAPGRPTVAGSRPACRAARRVRG